MYRELQENHITCTPIKIVELGTVICQELTKLHINLNLTIFSNVLIFENNSQPSALICCM